MANSSSALEVLSVILPSVLLVFISTTFTTVFHSKFGNSSWRYISDFCTVVIPHILNVTILVKFMGEVFYFLVFICLCMILLAYVNGSVNRGKQMIEEESTNKCFVTNIRATINLITTVAILAVDFTVFPKQFKKQLKYGYSLMDVGVGLFVYANGIVAPEINQQRNSFKKSLIDTVPLIVLGVGRYFATTVTNYNVSVTEYGKHWNFFITLAVTRIISSFILIFINLKLSVFCGLVILSIHEVFLQMGLAEYVFSSIKRDNFLSANREGIVSTLGFIALYFLSVGVGMWLNLKEKGISSKIGLFFKFSFTILLLLPLMFVLDNKFGMSRRLSNSTYCIWILLIGVLMTGLFYVVEILQNYLYHVFNLKTHIYVPFILDAVNYNGLIYFLLANVLTGIVNMACETLLVSHFNSIAILIAYMSVTTAVICILYVKRINLKLLISYLTKPKKKFYNV